MIFTEKGFKKALSEVMYGNETAKEKYDSLISEIERLKIEQKDLAIIRHKETEKLKSDIASLESRRKVEEEEIKHLIKMKEEKLLLDTQRKEIELQKIFSQREIDLQTKYHEKVLLTIDESRKESKELFSEIMKRLPNVNMNVNRKS